MSDDSDNDNDNDSDNNSDSDSNNINENDKKYDPLGTLSDDVANLWCPSPTVPILQSPPSALVFLRDYVAPSRPCIIRGALPLHHHNVIDNANDEDGDESITHCTQTKTKSTNANDCCLENTILHRNRKGKGNDKGNGNGKRFVTLTLDEIVDWDENLRMTVDVTPDGHGDDLRWTSPSSLSSSSSSRKEPTKRFVRPYQAKMSIHNFRTLLRRRQRYEQSQPLCGYSNQKDWRDKVFPVDPLSHTPTNHPPHVVEPQKLVDNTDQEPDHNNDGWLLSEDENNHVPPPVVYYSLQNDCLRNEFQSVLDRMGFPQTFAFAEDAFGTGPPEAINLWIGNECSSSSMHKDHYENLFYVLSGTKVFTLCPPSDVPFLYQNQYESGAFQPPTPPPHRHRHHSHSHSHNPNHNHNHNHNSNTNVSSEANLTNNPNPTSDFASAWSVRLDTLAMDMDDNGTGTGTNDTHTNDFHHPVALTQWVEPDVTHFQSTNATTNEEHSFPLLELAHPMEVTLEAGDMLYLPALWFHHVTQTSETVAINYWYDMKFDSKWCYFSFLQNISSRH